MDFFSDFALIKQKQQYSIKYKGHPFISVNMGTLEMFMLDKKNDIKPTIGVNAQDDIRLKAMKLISLYETRKKEFYFNKDVQFKLTTKDPDFKHFEKAVILLERHDSTYEQFLESQIHGLKFINNGQGTYPKPSQLSSNTAEDRLLQFQLDNKKETIGIALSKKDIDTPLSENKMFTEYSRKIMEGIATLKEARYVQKLILLKKKKTIKKVEEYIEGLM